MRQCQTKSVMSNHLEASLRRALALLARWRRVLRDLWHAVLQTTAPRPKMRFRYARNHSPHSLHTHSPDGVRWLPLGCMAPHCLTQKTEREIPTCKSRARRSTYVPTPIRRNASSGRPYLLHIHAAIRRGPADLPTASPAPFPQAFCTRLPVSQTPTHLR